MMDKWIKVTSGQVGRLNMEDQQIQRWINSWKGKGSGGWTIGAGVCVGRQVRKRLHEIDRCSGGWAEDG